MVQLADQRIYSWMRTDQGEQFACLSSDNGNHWSLPEKTSLHSPESPASIKRLPGSSRLLAIYNDNSGEAVQQRGRRTPLVAAISNDNGKTWTQRHVIESDPRGSFCYCAICFIDNAALLSYCAGDDRVGPLGRLRIRRLPLDWINKS